MHVAYSLLRTVSRRSLEILWNAFNDIADGFGVTEEEFVEICLELREAMGVSEQSIQERASTLFKVYDTDQVSTPGVLVWLARAHFLNRMALSMLWSSCARSPSHLE
jgi:hypothetical protein